MSAEVTIHRDTWGVPHVRASSEEDGFFGVGYAQAEDHLELLLTHYALLRGELALRLGTPEAIVADVRSLRWRHLEETRATFGLLSEPVRRAATAFVEGVRAYLDEHPTDDVPPLEPALAVAIHRLFLFDYYVMDGLIVCASNGIHADPEVSELVPIFEQLHGAGLSNEWVLMPSRTEENALILLSDPHSSLEGLPMCDVEVQAGSLKYAGYHVIGAALPMLGHTRHLAWGCTTGSPVVSDCYSVQLDGSSYLYDGERRAVRADRVEIRVRGRPGPEVRVFEYTEHNGVLSAVVARDGANAYVVSSPYMHVPHLLEEQAYGHLIARSVDDVRENMRAGVGWFPQNLMYGDAAGSAWYVRNGRAPIRPEGIDISKPLDGNTSATAWLGIHSVDDLVQIENPECGYMQNNNVAPDRMVADATGTTLEAHLYPAYIYGDTPGRTNSRGIRGVELLAGSVRASEADAVAIAVDDKMPGTERWLAVLAQALECDGGDRPGRTLARRLLAYDGRARADSVAALNYWYWRTLMLGRPGASDEIFQRIDESLPIDASAQAILLDAADEAVRFMRETHGSSEIPMGDVFRVGCGVHSYPGRCATIPSRIVPDRDHPHDSSVMALHLMIYGEPDESGRRWAAQGSHTLRLTIFSDPVRSYSLLNRGQSGAVDSPHHCDQAQLYSEGRLRPTYFEDADLEGNILSTKRLERAKRARSGW